MMYFCSRQCFRLLRRSLPVLLVICFTFVFVLKTKNMVNPQSLKTTNSTNSRLVREKLTVSSNVHIFYYAWYGSKHFDGEWVHWNHEYIPPWDKNDHNVYPVGKHDPDKDDIGSNFFPEAGPYSSRNKSVIELHMKQIRQSGAGVVVVSWYPPNTSDENGRPVDELLPKLLDAAQNEDLKIALHVEPYTDRNPENFRSHLSYVTSAFASHPAFYKRSRGSKSLPVYYIYDSYRTPAKEWARLLSKTGDLSIRNTHLDGIFLGLLVEVKHRTEIFDAKFDGFYTYFAANGFTYGSSVKSWSALSKFARTHSLIFVPSVGPGYIDTRIRPWNGKTTRHRRNGEYYNFCWKAAVGSNPQIVSVTSFNEWHEGTQIEPAIQKTTADGTTFEYLNYEPQLPDLYLKLTRNWTDIFVKSKQRAQTQNSTL